MRRMVGFIGVLLLVTLVIVQGINGSIAQSASKTSQVKKLEMRLDNRAAFASDDRFFYVLRESTITAISRDTWRMKWSFTASQTLVPKLEIDGEQLYALTTRGVLVALALDSGRKSWSKTSFQRLYFGSQTPRLIVALSFFLFRTHLMVSQENEYVTFSKTGMLLGGKKNEDKTISSYSVKVFENSRFYALGEVMTFRSSVGNPDTIRLQVNLFDNDRRYDPRSRTAFEYPGFDTGSGLALVPFNTITFDTGFLSTVNLASVVNRRLTASETPSEDPDTYLQRRYIVALYNFSYSDDPRAKLNRSNTKFFGLTSRIVHGSWCQSGWCEYTQTPKDFYPIGVFGDRVYFMTDRPEARFAWIARDGLADEPVLRAGSAFEAWAARVQSSKAPPNGYLPQLTEPNATSDLIDTAVFVARGKRLTAVISRDNRLTVVEDGQRWGVVLQPTGNNFIPARDLRMGDSDVVVYDGALVIVYKKEK